MHRSSAPILSLIVAMDRNGVIGRAGALPWHLPADLRYFKRMTLGKPVLMGRRTFESIGRPLPGRRNVVLTRDPHWRHPGCEVAPDLDEALALVSGVAEVMVIGGAAVYAAALPRCQRLYVTHVDADVVGDTRFPQWSPREWREAESITHPADEANPYACRFVVYERRERSSRR